MNIRISKSLGHYNMVGNEKSWSVQVLLPDERFVGASWPEDEEPDISGMTPSEVLALIKERRARNWIDTGREKDFARIDAALRQSDRMDMAWLWSQAEALDKRADQLHDEASAYRRRHDAIEEREFTTPSEAR